MRLLTGLIEDNRIVCSFSYSGCQPGYDSALSVCISCYNSVLRVIWAACKFVQNTNQRNGNMEFTSRGIVF